MAKVEEKQIVVNEIKDKVLKSKSIVIADSRGLTVAEDTTLRKKLREANIDFKVYKNTMVNFAIQGTEYEGLKDFLKGPSVFAFSYEDSMEAAKIINKLMKEMPNLEFKAGVIESELYDAEAMKIVASIPSKEELLAKLLGSLKAPMSSFARLVSAIAEKNGAEA